MEAEARSLSSDGSLEGGLRELRDAIELREAEHARRNANRVLFSRGVLLFFIGIFGGLLILGRGYDQDVYRDRLYQRLQAGAPSIIKQWRAALTELEPVYKLEISRTMVTFNENANTAIRAEADKTGENLMPVLVGDYLPLTEGANQELAAALLKRFGPELGNDPAKALEVARALRAEQLKVRRNNPAELGGAFVALDEIRGTARALGAPDAQGLNNPEVAASMTATAMDTVKNELMSGEIGFRTEEKAPPNANKGAK
jgi:hypothetical protein